MRQRRLVLLVGLLVLGGLAGLGGWAYHKTTRPDYRLRRGREAARAGDYARAEDLADRLQAAGCSDHAHLLRAEALFRRAHPERDEERSRVHSPLLDQALAELSQVQDQGDLGLDAAGLAGQCLLYADAERDAERAFRLVLAKRPDDADAHRGLGAIYYNQGALGRAITHLDKVAHVDPEDGRPHRFMGMIYKQLGQPEDAIERYREALRRKLKGRVAQEVRVELATALVQNAGYAEALEVLDGCDGAMAATVEARTLRAECLWGGGDAPAARALLDQILADEPDGVPPLVLLGRIHIAAGEYREAAAVLERAAALDPSYALPHFQLAQAYRGLERAREAAEQQQVADQIVADSKEMARLNGEANDRPWDAEVRRRLAALAKKRGKPDEAAMWLKSAEACADAPPTDAPPR